MATHTWLLVKPGEAPERVELPAEGSLSDHYARLLGGRVDFELISRHFEVVVYEWSVNENWPLNFNVHRGNKWFPLQGPVLIHKCDDRGETVSITDANFEALYDYIALQRTGVILDSLGLG